MCAAGTNYNITHTHRTGDLTFLQFLISHCRTPSKLDTVSLFSYCLVSGPPLFLRMGTGRDVDISVEQS